MVCPWSQPRAPSQCQLTSLTGQPFTSQPNLQSGSDPAGADSQLQYAAVTFQHMRGYISLIVCHGHP
jgi:hypothetical protein